MSVCSSDVCSSDLAGDDIADTVAAFVCGPTEVMKAHPWWPQLWVREVLCEGGALRDLLVTRIAPQITRTIADRFAAAQARGEMNADLDPSLPMTSLIDRKSVGEGKMVSGSVDFGGRCIIITKKRD